MASKSQTSLFHSLRLQGTPLTPQPMPDYIGLIESLREKSEVLKRLLPIQVAELLKYHQDNILEDIDFSPYQQEMMESVANFRYRLDRLRQIKHSNQLIRNSISKFEADYQNFRLWVSRGKLLK